MTLAVLVRGSCAEDAPIPPLRNAWGGILQQGVEYPFVYGLPTPITPSDVDRFLVFLKPEEEKLARLRTAFVDYQSREQQVYQKYAQPLWHESAAINAGGDIGGDPDAAFLFAETVRTRQPEAFRRLVAVEAQLFAEWRAELPDEKWPLLARLGKWRERVRCPVGSENIFGSSLDLYTLLTQLELNDADMTPSNLEAFRTILQKYDDDASAAAHARHEARLRRVIDGTHPSAMRLRSEGQTRIELVEKIESLNRNLIQAEEKLVQILVSTEAQLHEILPPATARELRDRVQRAIAPSVYPDPTDPLPLLDAAIVLEGLDESIQATLLDLRNVIAQRHDALCTSMARHQREWRVYLGVHSRVDEMFERHTAAMNKLHADRVGNLQTAIQLLQSILPSPFMAQLAERVEAQQTTISRHRFRSDPRIRGGDDRTATVPQK